MSEAARPLCLKPQWPPVKPFSCLWVCVAEHGHGATCQKVGRWEWMSFIDVTRLLDQRDNEPLRQAR